MSREMLDLAQHRQAELLREAARLRAETRAALQGIGTGSAAEHWQALREGGARLYGSGMSSKARGVEAGDGVQLAPPSELVRLIAEADRIVSY